MKYSAAIALAIFILLSACEREADETTSKAQAPTTVNEKKDDIEAFPSATLKIAPNPVNVCDSKVTTVKVTWDIAETPIRDFSMWVQQGNQKPKLWFESRKLRGEKMSGNFVRGKTRFFISSPKNDLVVSEVVNSTSCETLR